MGKSIEHLVEVLIFNSRWLLAPFYLGLVVGIMILLVKFLQEFVDDKPWLHLDIAGCAWNGPVSSSPKATCNCPVSSPATE